MVPEVLRFGGHAVKTWFGRLSAPYKLTFSLTTKCNLRCSSCNIWKQETTHELTAAEIDTFFMRNPEIRWLDFTGGEIMLRGDLEDIIKSVKIRLPRLFQFHFPCNGTLPERTERAVRLAVSLSIPKVVVSISMDGPRDMHDTIRGKTGTWDSAVETYRRIRAISGVDVYFGMTLTHENVHHIEETLRDLQRMIPGLSLRDLHINVAHSTFYYGDPEIVLPDHLEIRHVLRSIQKSRGFPSNPVLLLEWLYQRRIPSYLMHGTSPIACQALSSSLFLMPDGSVFPCTSWDLPLANIREEEYDLHKLWNSARISRFVELIRKNECPGCWTPCEAYQSIIASLYRPRTWIPS